MKAEEASAAQRLQSSAAEEERSILQRDEAEARLAHCTQEMAKVQRAKQVAERQTQVRSPHARYTSSDRVLSRMIAALCKAPFCPCTVNLSSYPKEFPLPNKWGPAGLLLLKHAVYGVLGVPCQHQSHASNTAGVNSIVPQAMS